MPVQNNNFLQIAVLLILISAFSKCIAVNNNLTCYQCERRTDTMCAPEELLPCPSVSDRCVTHISKSVQNGFLIKRECGLGPCGFDDVMANKGLGLNCDTSRKEYFCIFCCRTTGCNHAAYLNKPSKFQLFIFISAILYVFRG